MKPDFREFSAINLSLLEDIRVIAEIRRRYMFVSFLEY